VFIESVALLTKLVVELIAPLSERFMLNSTRFDYLSGYYKTAKQYNGVGLSPTRVFTIQDAAHTVFLKVAEAQGRCPCLRT
jgi:hypothetical protein